MATMIPDDIEEFKTEGEKCFYHFLDTGKTVKLIEYDGQRHSFINEAWYDFMDRVSKFFNLNVKNVE